MTREQIVNCGMGETARNRDAEDYGAHIMSRERLQRLGMAVMYGKLEIADKILADIEWRAAL